MHQLIWRQAAMLEREDRRDLHWRQPWTSDSLALGSEMKTRNHPIGRATDICPWSGCFYCWFVKTGTIYCQCSQGFFPATRESKVLSRTFSRPFGSIPCVASSAATWVNLPNVGGQPTQMYQVRQWACNRHLGYGRTSALQYRLKSSTRVTLFIFVRDYYWTTVERKEPLPVSTSLSVSHLNYESRHFDIRYVGHQ